MDAKERQGWRNAKARRMGLREAAWRGRNGLRSFVLRRDGFRCQLRLPGCEGVASSVHIAPVLGGDHRRATPGLCVSACRSCHGRVDGGRARRKQPAAVVAPVAEGNRFLSSVVRR